MITCPKCKKKLPEDAEICQFCGSEIKYETLSSDLKDFDAPTASGYEGKTEVKENVQKKQNKKKKSKSDSKKTVITIVAAVLAVTITFGAILLGTCNPTLDIKGFDAIKNLIKNPVYNNDDVVTVTFPEGYTVTQIAEKLAENRVCNADEFLERAQNPSDELLEKLEITNKDERVFTLEGYLFPDTYEFYIDESVDSVIGRFTDNYFAKITDKDKARAAELGYSMDEIMTIASIVQAEAGNSENYKVSSVIHNRLNTGTPIECDVTINYLETHCNPFLEDGITEDNRNNYNTYKCPALPKGPICNPGYDSIKAALYPADTDFLFFVTDQDLTTYYYATTWDEHVANCHTAGIPGY